MQKRGEAHVCISSSSPDPQWSGGGGVGGYSETVRKPKWQTWAPQGRSRSPLQEGGGGLIPEARAVCFQVFSSTSEWIGKPALLVKCPACPLRFIDSTWNHLLWLDGVRTATMYFAHFQPRDHLLARNLHPLNPPP